MRKSMTPRRLAAGIAAVALSMHTSAMSANFTIDNPAANIYNPAAHMDNPSPLSPPTQPVPPPGASKEIPASIPAGQTRERQQSQPKLAIPHKSYHLKTAGAYVAAAKKAFSRDDHTAFLSITEDALRRINAGTLRAADKTKQTLVRYRTFGYGLLEKDTTEE
jgi:hypothetical protein